MDINSLTTTLRTADFPALTATPSTTITSASPQQQINITITAWPRPSLVQQHINNIYTHATTDRPPVTTAQQPPFTAATAAISIATTTPSVT
jgi:hypothetical protein